MDNKKIIKVPDIGNYNQVDIIDIVVKIGDQINIDDNLITLETDKATVDIPSTVSGVITNIFVKIGDKVSQDSPIVEVLTNSTTSTTSIVVDRGVDKDISNKETNISLEDKTVSIESAGYKSNFVNNPKEKDSKAYNTDDELIIYAGPAVRKLARELGVDLKYVSGSGNKNRILAQDVTDYVKNHIQDNLNTFNHLADKPDILPLIDFSKYGEVEIRKLSKIQKLSSMNLHRNWINIPHVTQHTDADFTETEKFRQNLNDKWKQDDLKCSPLVLIIKAVTYALQVFPEFNSSLDNDKIILKKFYNIGFAADTPNGLVVPVIKDVNHKGLKAIAQELKDLSSKARLNKLSLSEIQGSTFTVSSLGGIGGNYFTPIINAPEVAILGVCKNNVKPIYDGKEFIARLVCPLSLSYDHRVIDGALACRFITYLSYLLFDIRNILV